MGEDLSTDFADGRRFKESGRGRDLSTKEPERTRKKSEEKRVSRGDAEAQRRERGGGFFDRINRMRKEGRVHAIPRGRDNER